MVRKIRWTDRALNDLEEIHAYIEQDYPGRASDVANEIVDAADELAEFSMRGHIVEELPDTSLRQMTVKGFRLIHHVGEYAVHIIAVIHGARDLVKLWEREGRERP